MMHDPHSNRIRKINTDWIEYSQFASWIKESKHETEFYGRTVGGCVAKTDSKITLANSDSHWINYHFSILVTTIFNSP